MIRLPVKVGSVVRMAKQPEMALPSSSKRRRLLVIGAVSAIAAAAVALAAVAALAGDGRYAVNGKVLCYNHAGSVGIWVEAEKGGSGFATLHEIDVADGWGWTRFSAIIPNGGSYKLNVGCGGNPKEWEMTAHSDSYSKSELNLICNDVPPWLEFLGKQFLPILRRAFEIDVPYGRCEEAKQVSKLEPKPQITEAKPLPTPTFSKLPTLPVVPQPEVVPQQPQKPPQDPPAPTTAGPQPQPPAPHPVVHYDCANDNSNIGHYVPANKTWYEGFVAQGRTITSGWVLIGAHENGANHAGYVQIYTGPLRTGQLLGQVQVNAIGYDGEPFAFPSPVQVSVGQQLYLHVTGIGDFTAYDSRAGCFIARLDGMS